MGTGRIFLSGASFVLKSSIYKWILIVKLRPHMKNVQSVSRLNWYMSVFADQISLLSTQIYFAKQRIKLLKMQHVNSISTLISLRAEFLWTTYPRSLWQKLTLTVGGWAGQNYSLGSANLRDPEPRSHRPATRLHHHPSESNPHFQNPLLRYYFRVTIFTQKLSFFFRFSV
jgi:hypothetical protein